MNHIFILAADLNAFDRIESQDLSTFFSDSLLAFAAQFKTDRRKQYLLSRFLLRQILIAKFGLKRNERLPEITTQFNERPFFKACHLNLPDFNVSHSAESVMIAVATQGKVGLDLEKNRTRSRFLNIARSCFSAAEQHWVETHQNPLAAFWQLWTLREAALKLYGKGVWQMKQLQINPQTKQISADFGSRFYAKNSFQNGAYVAICSDLPIDKVQKLEAQI